MTALEECLEKLRGDGASPLAIRKFTHYWHQVQSGATGLIPEDTIEPIESVESLGDTHFDEAEVRDALGKTAFLKLNGGLGTSMGLDRAKSLIPVRDGLRFIDIIMRQVEYARATTGVNIPLLLMDSFRTARDMHEIIPDDFNGDVDFELMQGREPKILADTLAPATWEKDPALEWCPPGHGDIYTAMWDTGLLDKLLEAGYRYLNTSNADNLGAFPSGEIAAWFAASGADYCPEVCVRTLADVKGGHLARRKADGRVILRDTAQTPPEDMDYFTDLHRHPYFHTNNLWFNLESLRDLLKRNDGFIDLPLIRNHKTVDPRDPESPAVVQIECAMGAIVEFFPTAIPLDVPRSRFLPVKTTNDLLPLRSDAYRFSPHSSLDLLAEEPPVVFLDKHYFKNIADFEDRIPTVPSLRECHTLTVTGDWRFEQPSTFCGDVTITGNGVI